MISRFLSVAISICILPALFAFSCNKKDRTGANDIKEDFMAGTYDGQPYSCVGVSVLVAGGITTVQGVTAEGKSVMLIINGTDLGAYEYGNPTHSKKAEIRCNITPDVYETVYTQCGPPSSTNYASGTLTIKRFEREGQIIAGEFSATLYNDENCKITTKKISGSFSTKK